MNCEKKALIIAPHPDDEVLGCGGIIRKMTTNNIKVWVLIMSRGKKGMYSEEKVSNVRKEALEAHKILGIDKTIFLEYAAPELDIISISELSRSIYEVFSEFKPDSVYVPHRGDIHHDHKAVFNASLVAARPAKGSNIKYIFSYETMSETEWAAPFSDDAFIPDLFVNVEEAFIDKINAMKCYKSQLRDFPNPRSIKSIEALAILRGSTVGFTHAEAFMTIRIIKD